VNCNHASRFDAVDHLFQKRMIKQPHWVMVSPSRASRTLCFNGPLNQHQRHRKTILVDINIVRQIAFQGFLKIYLPSRPLSLCPLQSGIHSTSLWSSKGTLTSKAWAILALSTWLKYHPADSFYIQILNQRHGLSVGALSTCLLNTPPLDSLVNRALLIAEQLLRNSLDSTEHCENSLPWNLWL